MNWDLTRLYQDFDDPRLTQGFETIETRAPQEAQALDSAPHGAEEAAVLERALTALNELTLSLIHIYQTYDVTELLTSGENDLCVMLGDGWYKGRFSFFSAEKIYGDTEALLFELRITLRDGSEQVIASDLSWQAQRSQIRFSNIYDGEVYDATFSDETLYPVKTVDLGFDLLRPRLSPPVIITEKITPCLLYTSRCV